MKKVIMIRSFVFCFLIILSFGLKGQNRLKDVDAKLDLLFAHYNDGNQPGLSLAIMEKGQQARFKSYGNANLEYGIKNSENTLFNATDLSKQFTIFCILTLQDEGLLSLDDKVKKHIPLLRSWPFDITLNQLMEQTSGLRDVMELKLWSGYQNGDVISKQDILEVVSKQSSLNFPSGSRFDYCRTGFVLLAEVIEQVSGLSFPDYVEQNIFKPLSMHNSVFVESHDELVEGRSYGYSLKDDEFIKVPNNSSFIGGTNLYTTTADFAKWLHNMSDPKVGKPSFFTYMHTKIQLPEGRLSNYTPGIFKEDSEGYWRIHLEGFDHGYTGYMMQIPEYGFSLVYFSNNDDFPIDEINKKLWSWFNLDYNVSLVEPFTSRAVRHTTKSSKELRSYIGTYLFEDVFNAREIELENDTLYYVRSEENRNAIVPIEGEHAFKMLVPYSENVRVIFNPKGDGLIFKQMNGGKDNDYILKARKLSLPYHSIKPFNIKLKNDLLNHSIMFKSVDQGVKLIFNNKEILLKRIGVYEFLTQDTSTVKHISLIVDAQKNIIGASLSGDHIRSLHYKVLKH